jgi:hypothetical protein
MSETICIPKERYEFLLSCEKLVDSEFNEKFSDEFLKEVKKSEEAYKKGDYIEVKNSSDRDEIFDSL